MIHIVIRERQGVTEPIRAYSRRDSAEHDVESRLHAQGDFSDDLFYVLSLEVDECTNEENRDVCGEWDNHDGEEDYLYLVVEVNNPHLSGIIVASAYRELEEASEAAHQCNIFRDGSSGKYEVRTQTINYSTPQELTTSG